MWVESTSPVRQGYYRLIAQHRCYEVNGVWRIVNHLLEGIFRRLAAEHGIIISATMRCKIKSITGERIARFLRAEYINKVVEVYQRALSGLSDEDLMEVARHPQADPSDSEAHEKFCRQEQKEFLPVKAEIVDGLVKMATQISYDPSITDEILAMVTTDRFAILGEPARLEGVP